MHLLARLSLKNRALIALVTIVASVFGLIGVGSVSYTHLTLPTN